MAKNKDGYGQMPEGPGIKGLPSDYTAGAPTEGQITINSYNGATVHELGKYPGA